jgi:hypothetical protein
MDDLAAIGAFYPEHQLDQSRLTGPVRPDQGHDLAAADIKINARDDVSIAAPEP